MGNLCDCFNQKDDYPTPKTPLLTAASPNHQTNATGPATTAPPGQSARQFKPPEKHFESSLNDLTAVNLVRVSAMPAMDKTFQDHAKLYNDMYSNFVELRKCLNDFKAKFVVETAGIPVMADCLRILSSRCGDVALIGSRRKNCIEIVYDRTVIAKICKGPSEDVLETLELYNKANKLIRSVLEKSTSVKNSISLILEEEEKLKREVTKADPDGKLGPEPLRMTAENLTKLGKLPDRIDTIIKYTSKTFKEINEGSRVLFEGPNAQGGQ